MKESKVQINKRKIANGKRKQFEKIHGTPSQIWNKLSGDNTPKKTGWRNLAEASNFMHGINRSFINGFTAQSGVGKSMIAFQSLGRAVRTKNSPILIDFESSSV